MTRLFWTLLRAVRTVLSPLGYFFRIREELSIFAKAALILLFMVITFGLWCWATNSPEWLNRGIEKILPRTRVQIGDPVRIRLDRATRKLHLQREGSRDVEADLPEPALTAMPPFTAANYPGVFEQLASFGLGDFQTREDGTTVAKIADLKLAKATGGFDPMPFQLPIVPGEPVTFTLDTLRGRLSLFLQRDSLRKAVVPYQGDPKKLEDTTLNEIAPKLGVAGPFQRKDDTTVMSTVGDPAVFREATGLGPANPVEPLALGEEVTIEFKPEEQSVLVSMPRTGKQRSIPINSASLAPEALPELSLSAYPGLDAALASQGVGIRMPPESPPILEAFIANPDAAVARGFGLYRPTEMRRVVSLPSPGEVAEGLPILWFDRNLAGGFRLSKEWPFITDFSWARFKDSALAVTLERIGIGFLLAAVVALPLGILMGAFTKFQYFFEPIRIAGLYLPLPAFVPLTLFWAGIGENQKYLYLFVCNFVVLLPYTIVAIQSVPQVYLDTAATLGLSRAQTLRRVLIGVAKPDLWKALRFTFGVGWTWIILAESVGVDNGLGYIIWTSERRGHKEHVYVVILLIMLLAFLINAVWSWVIGRLFPYERSR